jgi:hypothetical protein
LVWKHPPSGNPDWKSTLRFQISSESKTQSGLALRVLNHLLLVWQTKRIRNEIEICLLLPWRRGAVDTASASGTEGPGSNPARLYEIKGKHIIAVVYCWLNMHWFCV